MSTTSEIPVPSVRRLRWKPAVGILFLAAGVLIAFWWKLDSNRTYQIFAVWMIGTATGVLLAIWWVFLSGVHWLTRLKGVGIGLLIAVALRASLVVEQYWGEMIPIIRFRWTPTAQERAAAYWKTTSVTTSSPTVNPKSVVAGTATPEREQVLITDADWPEFRGRDRDGVVRGLKSSSLRRDWRSQPPRELWRHPVGLGWSSFAVVGHRAFTQEQRGTDEVVVCYDFLTGAELWSHADRSRFSEQMGGDGPRATPTIHDGKLFALGAAGILKCLDAATGSLVWSVNILTDNNATNISWGMAGSPLVIDDVVIVTPGGKTGGSVAAYDRETGKKSWSSGDNQAAYVAPQRLDVDGRPVVLIYDAIALHVLDPRTGVALGPAFSWANDAKINCTQPAVWQTGDQINILVGSGYAKGCVLLSLDHPGEQDWSLVRKWDTTQLKPKFNSAVIRDGHVYGLDEGVLTCLRLSDGGRRWKQGRFGFGQMLLIDDLLLIQAESGDVVLVDANPEKFHEVTRFTALTNKSWNHPVVAHGKLLVRNGEEAACFELEPNATAGRN
jgi:outer membrane protein assembly factor BamB